MSDKSLLRRLLREMTENRTDNTAIAERIVMLFDQTMDEVAFDQCTEKLVMADDVGVNECTFRCKLAKGHNGPHVENGAMYRMYPYAMSWFEKKIDEEKE